MGESKIHQGSVKMADNLPLGSESSSSAGPDRSLSLIVKKWLDRVTREKEKEEKKGERKEESNLCE